jgi:hypothetical protein
MSAYSSSFWRRNVFALATDLRSRFASAAEEASPFSEPERATLRAYLDTLLPETALGPSASEVGVPEYIESLCRGTSQPWRAFRKIKKSDTAALLTFYRCLVARIEEFSDDHRSKPFWALSARERSDLIAEFANSCERESFACDPADLLPEELADSDLYRISRVHAIQGYFEAPKRSIQRESGSRGEFRSESRSVHRSASKSDF